MTQEKLTPMLEQYKTIKLQNPDALLFFRMGDFYELFFEDALVASKELQIALTSRGKGTASNAPMCGVPRHAARSYIAQLLEKGFSVAICEQMEDPGTTRGLLARAVTQVITPGTLLEDDILGESSNYLGAAICGMHDSCAFAWADISTGQWSGMEFRKQSDMCQWILKLQPKELLLVDGQHFSPGESGIRVVHRPAITFELKRSTERLLQLQQVRELNALGLEAKPALVRACGALVSYLEQTQPGASDQLKPFRPMDSGRRLVMDELTERNLELFTRQNGRKGKGTLRHVLNGSVTSMGTRLLDEILHNPWREPTLIQRIQECVRFFMDDDETRQSLRQALRNISDIERIIMRVALDRAQTRDYFSLRQSLLALPSIRKILNADNCPAGLSDLLENLDDLQGLADFLKTALAPELPVGEESVFRAGFNPLLDEQLDLMSHGEEKLNELLEEERKRTGINRLKLGYNKIVGYFWEIPRQAMANGAPEHFIRRQGLANAERFTSEALQRLEEELLLAGDRRQKLEAEMLQNMRAHVAARKSDVLNCADVIGQLDYWQSLAEVGRRENWRMPEVDDSGEIHIREGRHPVIESMIGASNFVPNDFHMDSKRRLCLLTGPNMAGKSTVLRQVALIAILAQMGAPVPATSARLGVVDRLFSRIGASDDIAQGQSTFMVEMMETARILRQAGKRSLIILDEIGRGTSTFDGMALAWAVVEDLASRSQGQLRTLFATHYHELTVLEDHLPGVFTMNISVATYGKEIVFQHRLVPGPSDKSYGIEVARLAGVPAQVVQRAREVLKKLEKSRTSREEHRMLLPVFESGQSILKELQELKAAQLSPEEALALLCSWQKRLKGHGNRL